MAKFTCHEPGDRLSPGKGAAKKAPLVAAGLGGLALAAAAQRRRPRKPCCCPRGALGAAAPAPGKRRGELVTLPGGLEAYVVGRGRLSASEGSHGVRRLFCLQSYLGKSPVLGA
eukprot:s5449_g4.t1